MAGKTLRQTGSLLKFRLRLDRIFLPTWIVACVAFAVGFIPMLPMIVTSEEMLVVLKEIMASPAVVALCGIMYGDEYTFGIMYTQMMFVWAAVLVAIMNILLVVRHTRKDEEEGRLELLNSLPVGRAAPLTSLTLLVVATNVLIAGLSALAMVAFQMESIDLAGSLVFGAGLGGIGLIFAAVTMLFAQVSSTAKGTLGFSLAVLFVMYVLRAVGDLAPDATTNPLGFVSPFGLGQRTFPYYQNLWWPIGVMLLVAAVFAVAAFALNTHRNLGIGMLPVRTGRVHAGRLLRGQVTLSLKVMRGTMIAWAIVIFVLAISYGSVFNDLGAFYENSPMIQNLFGNQGADGSLIDPAIATLTVMMALITVIPVVTVINHLRTEERRGRLELVYSTASSKIIALAGYTITAVAFALLLQLLSAGGMWMGAYATMDDPIAWGTFCQAALNVLPPMLVFVGLAVLIVGLAPRAFLVVWVYLAYAFYVDYVGGMFDVPDYLTKLSPFGLAARYPVEEIAPLPLALLLLVFVALSVLGVLAYRRRDIK